VSLSARARDEELDAMTRRPDHQPATLEAHARRLELLTFAVERGVDHDAARSLQQTADLLRRLAEDLRLVDQFLRDASLLAPLEDPCPART